MCAYFPATKGLYYNKDKTEVLARDPFSPTYGPSRLGLGSPSCMISAAVLLCHNIARLQDFMTNLNDRLPPELSENIRSYMMIKGYWDNLLAVI